MNGSIKHRTLTWNTTVCVLFQNDSVSACPVQSSVWSRYSVDALMGRTRHWGHATNVVVEVVYFLGYR